MVPADPRLTRARRAALIVFACSAAVCAAVTFRWTAAGASFDGDRGGAFYWERLLHGWGHNAAESDGEIHYVWWGVDHHVFFSVNRSEAEAAYPPAVRDAVERYLRWMEQNPHASPPYSLALHSLTNHDFGDDPAAWRSWWESTRDGFTPDADAYQRLLRDRIQWEQAEYGVSRTAHWLANAPAAYRSASRMFWIERIAASAAVLSGAVFVLLLACGWYGRVRGFLHRPAVG